MRLCLNLSTLKSTLVCVLISLLLCIGLFPYQYVEFMGTPLGHKLVALGSWLADSDLSASFLALLGSIVLYCLFCRSKDVGFSSEIWLCLAIVLGALRFALDTSTDSVSNFIPLIAGLAIGITTSRLAQCLESRSVPILAITIIAMLLVLPTIQLSYPTVFRYHESVRASGPYHNPNTLGMLMGVGLILAVSRIFATPVGDRSGRIIIPVLATSVAYFAWWSTLSFSRGAWVATVAGLLSFGWARRGYLGSSRRAIVVTVLGIALGIGSAVSFKGFAHGENVVLHRAESVLNLEDFSWRNRLVAWHGALQIIAENPLLGVGWNSVRSTYENYHKPLTMSDGGAIETNDILKLGASAGVIFAAAWLTYVLLLVSGLSCSIPRMHTADEGAISSTATQSEVVRNGFCAAAFALACGSCFNPVWFEFSTASVFWCLVHLGANGPIRCWR